MEWLSREMRRRPGCAAATAAISAARRSPHTSMPSKVCSGSSGSSGSQQKCEMQREVRTIEAPSSGGMVAGAGRPAGTGLAAVQHCAHLLALVAMRDKEQGGLRVEMIRQKSADGLQAGRHGAVGVRWQPGGRQMQHTFWLAAGRRTATCQLAAPRRTHRPIVGCSEEAVNHHYKVLLALSSSSWNPSSGILCPVDHRRRCRRGAAGGGSGQLPPPPRPPTRQLLHPGAPQARVGRPGGPRRRPAGGARVLPDDRRRGGPGGLHVN